MVGSDLVPAGQGGTRRRGAAAALWRRHRTNFLRSLDRRTLPGPASQPAAGPASGNAFVVFHLDRPCGLQSHNKRHHPSPTLSCIVPAQHPSIVVTAGSNPENRGGPGWVIQQRRVSGWGQQGGAGAKSGRMSRAEAGAWAWVRPWERRGPMAQRNRSSSELNQPEASCRRADSQGAQRGASAVRR